MNQIKEDFFSEDNIDKLSKAQLKEAIQSIDSHITSEPNSNKIIQYCLLKIDLINKLMALDKKDHLKYR